MVGSSTTFSLTFRRYTLQSKLVVWRSIFRDVINKTRKCFPFCRCRTAQPNANHARYFMKREETRKEQLSKVVTTTPRWSLVRERPSHYISDTAISKRLLFIVGRESKFVVFPFFFRAEYRDYYCCTWAFWSLFRTKEEGAEKFAPKFRGARRTLRNGRIKRVSLLP